MPILLHISVSARGRASHSRNVGQELVDSLCAAHPDFTVVRRDLAADPLPHPGEAFVTAALMPAEARGPSENAALALSEMLISELEAADRVVIDTPMHNFTVPSALKAWLDHVVRIRRTFGVTPQGKVGFLADRPVQVVVACGGQFDGEGGQSDFLSPYLTYVLASIGLKDVDILRMELTTRGPEPLARAKAKATAWIGAHATAV